MPFEYDELMERIDIKAGSPVQECSCCGRDLYRGDTVYRLMGECFCPNCVIDAKERLR